MELTRSRWVKMKMWKEIMEKQGKSITEEAQKYIDEGERMFGVQPGKLGPLALTRKRLAAAMYVVGASQHQIAFALGIERGTVQSMVKSELRYKMPARQPSQLGMVNRAPLSMEYISALYRWLIDKGDGRMTAEELAALAVIELRRNESEGYIDLHESAGTETTTVSKEPGSGEGTRGGDADKDKR